MPANIKSTGPVQVFIQPGTTPLYLGTCEQYPIIEGEHAYEPVFNDMGGPRVPVDKEYQGSIETVILDLNRFNNDNINLIDSPPYYGQVAGSVPGVTDRLARGSLMYSNERFFLLYLVHSFFGTINAPAGSIGPGWVYWMCNTGAIMTPRQGTRNMMRRCIIEATPQLDDGSIGGNPGAFYLKSAALADFPAAVFVPANWI